MKEVMLVLGCLFLFQLLQAQTWSEWFRQNHTQLIYLQEQIAALRGLGSAVADGYAVSADGLLGIDTISQADYALHSDHFAHLRNVSAAVLADPVIDDLRLRLRQILQLADAIAALGLVKGQDWSEVARTIADDIRGRVRDMKERIERALTGGELEMDDTERMLVIRRIRLDSMSCYELAVHEFEDFKSSI